MVGQKSLEEILEMSKMMESIEPIECACCHNKEYVTKRCAVCGREVCTGCVDYLYMIMLDTSLPVCIECAGEGEIP